MAVKESTTHKSRLSVVNSMLVGQEGHYSDRLVGLGPKVLLILQLMILKMMSLAGHRNHFVNSFLAFMDSNKLALGVEISILQNFVGALVIEVLHISIGVMGSELNIKGQLTGFDRRSLAIHIIVVVVRHTCFGTGEAVVERHID